MFERDTSTDPRRLRENVLAYVAAGDLVVVAQKDPHAVIHGGWNAMVARRLLAPSVLSRDRLMLGCSIAFLVWEGVDPSVCQAYPELARQYRRGFSSPGACDLLAFRDRPRLERGNFLRRRWLLLTILTLVLLLICDAAKRFDCSGGRMCWQRFPIPSYLIRPLSGRGP